MNNRKRVVKGSFEPIKSAPRSYIANSATVWGCTSCLRVRLLAAVHEDNVVRACGFGVFWTDVVRIWR